MVPFVRVTRDKRGYEQIALMHAPARRGKPSKPRTLYVFRTPPGVKLGREPFDEPVRRAIEEQNPGVFFDWSKLSHIAPPPPDVEYWKEKRRAEKAAKQARRDEEQEASGAPAPEGEAPEGEAADTPEDPQLSAEPGHADAPGDAGRPGESEQPGPVEEQTAGSGVSLENPGSSGSSGSPGSFVPVGQPAAGQPDGQGRRRRRRGGRGRRGPQRPDALSGVPAEPPKVTEDPSKEG